MHMIVRLLLSAATANALKNAAGELTASLELSGISSLIGAVNNASFILVASIFTTITVCEDYEQQIVKNIFSRGYTRRQVYFGKLAAVLFGATVLFVVVEAAAFLLGSAFFGMGDVGNLKAYAVVGVRYVICMANIVMCYAISAVLRKNGSSIAACIVVPMLVNVALGMADTFLQLKDYSVTQLWISSFLEDVTSLAVKTSRMLTCLGASILYIPVFLFAGWVIFRKLEL